MSEQEKHDEPKPKSDQEVSDDELDVVAGGVASKKKSPVPPPFIPG